jgi:hypothetical protein
VAEFLDVVGCIFSSWGAIYSCRTSSIYGGCISLGKGGNSSVEDAFLELGRLSCVGKLYVLESLFYPLIMPIFFATKLYQFMGVSC